MKLVACLVSAALAAQALGDVAVCPGEGDRYGDHKCNHDPTHRVCAQLLDGNGRPLSWGKGDFWGITGQKAFQWDQEIRDNHGNSWCICMWATASLIEAAGCENVHLDCAATDVAYVLSKYSDGGVDLSPAKTCLQQKCGDGVAAALMSKSSGDGEMLQGASSGHGLGAAMALGLVAVASLGAASWRRQAATAVESEATAE